MAEDEKQLPWMELGAFEEVPETAAEAAQLGGFNFDVVTRPSGFRNRHGVWETNDKRHALVRNDNESFYDYVSPHYKVTQFRDAFSFADNWNMTYVAGGTLRKGKQAFLVGKFSDPYDQIAIVLRASHDRTRNLECSLLPGTKAAISGNPITFPITPEKVPYTNFRVADMREGQLHNWLHSFQESLDAFSVRNLFYTPLTLESATTLLDKSFPGKGKNRQKAINAIAMMTFKQAGTGPIERAILAECYLEYVEWRQSHVTAESKLWNALQGSSRKALKTILLAE